jgi:hypothetical protein
MPETNKYTGSCHCGKVRFEVEADLTRVNACNCSICSRAGYLLTFVKEDKFKLLSGESDQTDYQFAKKHIHHLFCSTCGIHSFGKGAGPDGSLMYAVNVRTIQNVDPTKLEIKHLDGRSA